MADPSPARTAAALTLWRRPYAWSSSLGDRLWRLLTSVRFAVIQLILLALAGLVGTIVRQVPAAWVLDPPHYALQMDDMHRRWDGIAPFGVRIGPGMVDLFDRLGFFRVFSAPWFVVLLTVLVVSIVCCTLNRLPRLWQESRRVTVVQPASFFDLRLANRARLNHADISPDDLARLLGSRHFRVRSGIDTDGATVVSGDRNQYVRLATLFTHLGLILFLLGGLITVTLGFETILFVAEGQTAPVRSAGTLGNYVVKNVRFEAPQRPNGSFADFRTDLEVYQDGALLARKTIRVNDPLQLGGVVFHQNTFGPAVDLRIVGPDGRLAWTGPVKLDQGFDGRPSGMMAVPGSDMGLLVVLDKRPDGISQLGLEGLGAPAADGSARPLFVLALAKGAGTDPRDTAGYSIAWEGTGAWTGLVVKNDPGQGVIWLAFASLLVGLVLSFYFPRRKVWARFEPDAIHVAMLADRYVDVDRELRALVARVSAHRGARRPAVIGSDG